MQVLHISANIVSAPTGTRYISIVSYTNWTCFGEGKPNVLFHVIKFLCKMGEILLTHMIFGLQHRSLANASISKLPKNKLLHLYVLKNKLGLNITAVWNIQRNNNRRQQLQGDRQNNMGYIRDPLIEIEPTSCPPPPRFTTYEERSSH